MAGPKRTLLVVFVRLLSILHCLLHACLQFQFPFLHAQRLRVRQRGQHSACPAPARCVPGAPLRADPPHAHHLDRPRSPHPWRSLLAPAMTAAPPWTLRLRVHARCAAPPALHSECASRVLSLCARARTRAPCLALSHPEARQLCQGMRITSRRDGRRLRLGLPESTQNSAA